MWTAIKSIFGFSGVGETALKIVEKVTGTDDSPDKKREFILAWVAATKHQSVARRTIALSITFVWVVMVLTCVVSYIAGRYFYDTAINPGTALAADISAFMQLNVSEPMNIVIVFYFTIQAFSSFKK
jgi:hypothetical protein